MCYIAAFNGKKVVRAFFANTHFRLHVIGVLLCRCSLSTSWTSTRRKRPFQQPVNGPNDDDEARVAAGDTVGRRAAAIGGRYVAASSEVAFDGRTTATAKGSRTFSCDDTCQLTQLSPALRPCQQSARQPQKTLVTRRTLVVVCV